MKKTVAFGLMPVLLAFGFALAGCNPGLIDDDIPVNIDDLPDLTGDQTGLPDFEELNRPLKAGSGMTAADVESLDIEPLPSEIGDGINYWNVFAGLLSFKVKTPESLAAASQWADGYLDADKGDDWKVIITGNAGMGETSSFKSGDYTIRRLVYEESGNNYSGSYREIGIDCIYVDANVTLRRGEVTESWNITGDWVTKTFKEVKLELKRGWNLVQTDYTHTWDGNTEDETISVTIATKDVPWTVDMKGRSVFGNTANRNGTAQRE